MDLRRLSSRLRTETTQPPTRPTISQIQQTATPSSPRTPTRPYTSTYSSPAGSYRSADDEDIVFSLGTRYLSAGVSSEPTPRCTLDFGPESSRRAGDYRQWLPGYNDRPRKKAKAENWGEDHELWQLDLRGRDIGLVGDKVQRAVREAYTRYLLLDAKSKRVVVVLPSALPHALIQIVVGTLFEGFQMPSVTLLAAPTMAVVGAGLRSGLVVDIGWRETVVTGVYEYRESVTRRTTRGMKMLTLEVARKLQEAYRAENGGDEPSGESGDENTAFDVLFEHAEEVTIRLAWCRSYDAALRKRGPSAALDKDLQNLQIDEAKSDEDDNLISLPLLSSSKPATSKLPFSSFSEPVEIAFLPVPASNHELDDHEQTLPLLIYHSLLQMPSDMRAVCMSRIVFTGGGSNIPGLKSRLLDEVSALVQKRGWDVVIGKAADEHRRRLREINHNRRKVVDKQIYKITEDPLDEERPEMSYLGAAAEAQTIDAIDEKFLKQEAKAKQGVVTGVVRGVESLGSWAGASLVGGLRIKGIVEIERETFLQHGLAGAKRDAETSVVQNRQSFGPGMAIGGADRVPWTLGAWA